MTLTQKNAEGAWMPDEGGGNPKPAPDEGGGNPKSAMTDALALRASGGAASSVHTWQGVCEVPRSKDRGPCTAHISKGTATCASVPLGGQHKVLTVPVNQGLMSRVWAGDRVQKITCPTIRAHLSFRSGKRWVLSSVHGGTELQDCSRSLRTASAKERLKKQALGTCKAISWSLPPPSTLRHAQVSPTM